MDFRRLYINVNDFDLDIYEMYRIYNGYFEYDIYFNRIAKSHNANKRRDSFYLIALRKFESVASNAIRRCNEDVVT